MAEMTPQQNKPVSIKSRFDKLDGLRNSILQRASECAVLTIPSLMPPQGFNENSKLSTPYQGLGARGVNNLASKLLLALLPPNSPFFRLIMDDPTLMKLTGNEQLRTQIEQALASAEKTIQTQIEVGAIRVPSFEALKLLIVTGNALEYLPDEGGMRVYRLDQYVVKRDPMGNVIEIIIKERVHPYVLPDSVQNFVLSMIKNEDETVEVYTQVKRVKKQWVVSQQVQDIDIPESSGTYAIDECPWIALRWSAMNGEDYGRGLVEEIFGDLNSLEVLTKAIVRFAAAASKILFLVKPNGTTRASALARSESGDIKEGNAEDVSVLQMEKFADFQVVYQTIEKIEARLSRSFLLMESVQRDAERVTAEEIRQLAKELEDSLGGVYSVLSQEKQLPLVRRLLVQLVKQKKMPPIPKKLVKPMIVTGLEALGRGNDLTKLMTFKQVVSDIPGAENYLKVGDFIIRAGTSLGIDTQGLVRTDEEVQMMIQQQTMSQMAGSVAPGVAQEITKGMVQNGQPGAGQQSAPGESPSG